MFVIEQALSVRALQELIGGDEAVSSLIVFEQVNTARFLKQLFFLQSSGMGSGHKTLLYGNAIMLRHHNSGMVRYIQTATDLLTIKSLFSVSGLSFEQL